MEKITNWNPDEGVFAQGDVVLMKCPKGFKISKTDEIKANKGRLSLAEGEVMGHHHAFYFPAMLAEDGAGGGLATIPRPRSLETEITQQHTNDMISSTVAKFRDQQKGTARLYRDADAINRLVKAGELTTSELAIGLLEVEGGPVILEHPEHSAVRVPTGLYYVGGQQEVNAGTKRRVAD